MTQRYLEEKTHNYRDKLDEAIGSLELTSEESAEEFKEMAESYLEDGIHFMDNNNYPDALAAFSYGHAWLDAGIRLGFFITDREELFAADI